MKASRSFFSLPWYIGWRYTYSRREQRFISFVSLISLLGLILGITAMILVLSVMNGFDRELKQRILKVIPHGFIESEQGFNNTSVSHENIKDWKEFASLIKTQPGIEGVAPLIAGKGLINYSGKTLAVEINGVLPETLSDVSSVSNAMVIGSMMDLNTEPFSIVLGQILARRLGVSKGDTVQLILPQINITPAGIFPRQKSFKVVGVFAVGADPDNQLVFIHINSAARLFQQMQADKTPLIKQLQIKTTDMAMADQILSSLQIALADRSLHIHSWADTHRTLFNAIKMEKHVITLLLFVVVTVAVFNIASILVMMVAEKRKDIAILQVMGTNTHSIIKIFIIQGLLIGWIGIGLGAILGSLLALYLSDMVLWLEALTGAHLFNADVFYIAKLPSNWRLGDVIIIVGVSMTLCVLATLYPAWKSGQINPVQSLNE